ncbi:MAG: hypothetical protein H0X33_14080 [Taibaiella sp.]|nr:hypothetical protein [Taibaiella sp.]
MLSEIVNEINSTLKPLFNGGNIYGLAQSIIKNNQVIPALVDNNGEGKYIGIDNTLPFIVYHKNNSISATDVPGQGDELNIKNTYSNVLIIYLNRKKTKILPDELFLNIQANPFRYKIQPFKNIVIRVQNVILNSQQVWQSEYLGSDYEITPDSNLLAINYTIESTFKRGCFDTCS